ncbi:MAG TPA: hypothetical protein VFG73_02350 [Rhodanobacteraceae bacterium]|nr:hypothetical protein [Rhodanobacteraceae bacterium]
MRVIIELKNARGNPDVILKEDLQRNIDALDCAIADARLSDARLSDRVLLMDTRSILAGIQTELPTAIEVR